MLFRTSITGPRPTGGSSPVRVVSCSSTSQRSYPWRSSCPTTSSIDASPSPSGRNSPSRVASTSDSSADRQVAGVETPVELAVLEHRLDVLSRLDERSGVRVKRELEAPSGGEL